MKLLLTIGLVIFGFRAYSQSTYIQVSNINIIVFGKSIIRDSTINLKTKNGKIKIILVKNDSILVTKTIKVRANKRGTGIKDLGNKTYYHNKEIKTGLTFGDYTWAAKGAGCFGSEVSNCEYLPIEDANKVICYNFFIKYALSKQGFNSP